MKRKFIFQKFNIIFFLILLYVTCGCQQKIEWPVKEAQKRLIVQGVFTDQLKKQEVRLTLSGNYFNESPAPFVNDAKVTISDGFTNYSLVQNAATGSYETTVPIKGEIGKTYILTIELKNKIFNQSVYTAISTMKRAFPMDSVNCFFKQTQNEYNEIQHIALVFLHGKETVGLGDNYMIKLFRNNVPITDTLNKFIFRNDNNSYIEGLSGIIAWYQNRKSFANVGDTLSAEIYGVNDEFEKFTSSIENSSVEPDPFGMDGPPANVKGNISNQGLGYFLAAPMRRKSCMIRPYDTEEAIYLQTATEQKH